MHSATGISDERRYEVRYHLDLREGAHLHWRLYAYGAGHWCVRNGHAGTFLTRELADEAGRRWVETGSTRIINQASRANRRAA